MPAVPDEPLPLLAEIAVDVPGHDAFTWRVPEALAADASPGACVTVPFGPRTVRGFIIAMERKAPEGALADKLKDVLSVRPQVRVPPHLLRLIRWGARYYRCSVGEFLAGAVPAAVREGKVIKVERRLTKAHTEDRRTEGDAGSASPVLSVAMTKRQCEVLAALPDGPLTWVEAMERGACTRDILKKLVAAGALRELVEDADVMEVRLEAGAERHAHTAEQQIAIDAVVAPLEAGRHEAFLLYGVTGSGKTLVYLDLAERVIASGKQVLFLLPEIGLTPQLAARVRARITRTVVWHSGFTDGERAELWRQVAAGEVDLVLGTRSALFAPLPAPGLIIVDEEHEHSYKQESVPRYHARDAAVVYAKQLAIPVILGSATPSLESVHNAKPADGSKPRYRVLTLKNRPLGGALPTPTVVDMRREFSAGGKRTELSRALVDALVATVQRREQAIILLNRRGWSPVVTCVTCGVTAQCGSCDISLTFHRGQGLLKCHYCGHERGMPNACPACGGNLTTTGMGTEQLEQLVRQTVPGCRTLRADADTTGGRQGHAKLLQAFANGEADILVGTQMVAKGLDFARVTLVGVLHADRCLSAPDFRAAERTYQLVAQVSGRAGRGARPGTVVVQAFDPEALPIACAVQGRPKRFYDAELALRAEYGYPPSSGLVRVMWSSPDEPSVRAAAEADGQRIIDVSGPLGAVVLGPTPAALAWLKGQHRWHLLIKAPSRGAAQHLLDQLGPLKRHGGVVTAIDVDPATTG